MKLERESFELSLHAGELVRLDSPRGVEVAVEAGQVWITEEACGEDLWLGPGERVRLEGRGVALVEAQHESRVRLAGA